MGSGHHHTEILRRGSSSGAQIEVLLAWIELWSVNQGPPVRIEQTNVDPATTNVDPARWSPATTASGYWAENGLAGGLLDFFVFLND
jgi:hypothetical protein